MVHVPYVLKILMNRFVKPDHIRGKSSVDLVKLDFNKVRKRAKIRHRYNQAPHLVVHQKRLLHMVHSGSIMYNVDIHLYAKCDQNIPCGSRVKSIFTNC